MQSITDIVRQILANQPNLCEMLFKNYINLSNLADDLIPQIEQLSYKTISKNSVVMALSRLQKKIQSPSQIVFKVNDIQVKYPLSEINFAIPLQFCSAQVATVYKQFSGLENHYLNIVSGNTETTIFVNSKLKQITAIRPAINPCDLQKR
jgi:hypothetical protein